MAKPQAVVVVVDPEKTFTERYILKPDKALVAMGIMMQVTAVLVRELGKYGKQVSGPQGTRNSVLIALRCPPLLKCAGTTYTLPCDRVVTGLDKGMSGIGWTPKSTAF